MHAPHLHRKGLTALLAVPALAAVPVLGHLAPGSHARAAVAGPAPAIRGAAARVSVSRSPRHLSGIAILRATVRSARLRLVAVTFELDGRPVGSDTTAPYTLDVDSADLPRGTHRLSAVAVDRMGRRSRSPAVAVRIARGYARAIHATPGRGLDRALEALRTGGVTVRLAPGTYAIDPLSIASGVRLVGAGPSTVLVPADGTSPDALVDVGGSDVRISNLAVDGLGRAGRAISVRNASDVRLQRLTIRGVQVNGVESSGVHREISIQDSTIDGTGASDAGLFDFGSVDSRDVSVLRTRISGFQGYGILFAQRFYALPTAALHNLALDNRISNIFDPARADGTDEGAIWTGGVEAAIIANHIRGTGIDGVETVGSSTRTTIVGNDIAATPVGVYLEHSTNDSLIAHNHIADVGTGINVEWRHAGGGSSTNTFAANEIVHARNAGLFVDVGSDANRIEGNVFVGGARPAIVLQGASNNVVRDNRGCAAAGGRMVGEQAGRWEDGSLATPGSNRIAGNVDGAACGR
ncbi:MAG: hypothetical protein QOG35_729 [Solirubrobacteraceae bacterium]|jgi:parallel beta-helix repeat protein|nr:hypothetical protein [Solirubrobacteraceae bacterium]